MYLLVELYYEDTNIIVASNSKDALKEYAIALVNKEIIAIAKRNPGATVSGPIVKDNRIYCEVIAINGVHFNEASHEIIEVNVI